MYIVICRPFDKLLFLDAVFIDTDPLSAQRRQIVRSYLGIVRPDKDMVVLRTHLERGIEDFFRALLSVRHVAEKINLTCDQHLKQFRPAAFHILIVPSGKSGNPLLIFIAVTGTPSKLITVVECRLVPPDTHGLTVFLRAACKRKEES